MSTPKVFVICGEASGDLHASNLVRELRTIDPRLTIQGWGGDLMKAEQVIRFGLFPSMIFNR